MSDPGRISALTLEWIGSGKTGGTPELEILIDGRRLADLVGAWELRHSPEPKIAGAYAGIHDYYDYALSDWLTQEEGTIQVLGCECGELGCWPLETRMTVTDRHVIWDQFAQPHRRETWSYIGFGPLVFDKAEFFTALQAVVAEAERRRLMKV